MTATYGVMDRTLDCYFGVSFNPCHEEWMAFKVYRDGNVIELGCFESEAEAEDCARGERESELELNGQFGVGA